jgi:hypothetical protein
MKRLTLFVALLGALFLIVAGPGLASPPPSPGPGSANACNGLHEAEGPVTNSTAFGQLVINDLALCHG